MGTRRSLIKKIVIAGLAASLIQAAASLHAGSSEFERAELTLQQAADLALQNNPLIKVILSGQDIADAQHREAWAGQLPLLQFNETFSRGNNPVFVFGSLLEQGRFGMEDFQLHSLNNPDPLNNFRTSIALKQPIFDHLKWVRIAQARIRKDQAEHQKEFVTQQVRFGVIRSYYGVLVTKAEKEVADEAVRMAEANVKQVRDRFEKGLTVQSDLLAAEVQLAEFQQEQIRAEGQVKIAYANLNTALGLPGEVAQTVTGQLVEKKFDVPDQEKMIGLALVHRPDYVRSELAIRSKKEEIRAARGEYLPRMDLFANYGMSGKDLDSGSSDYIFGASLTFNLFDGGRHARITQARAAKTMATAEQQHLANQIRLEIIQSYQEYRSALERLKVVTRTIDQASETLRIVRNRYREGLTTITEVLRAENALVRARMNLIGARYEHYIGYARLLLASGTLTDVESFGS